MPIIVGTSTYSEATASGNNRKIVKTTEGKLVLFAYTDSLTIKYKTSTDNGSTWSASWTTVSSASWSVPFDIYIETNNDILLVYRGYAGRRLWFRRLTYSAIPQTWSIGSAIQIDTSITIDVFDSICITKRSDGSIFVGAYNNFGSTTTYYIYYSTDLGLNWISQNITGITSPHGIVLIPVGSNIWAIYYRSSGLYYREYTSSWSSENIITSSGITGGLTCAKITDSNIWCCGHTSSGLKIYHYTSSWNSGELISNNSNDTGVTLQTTADKVAIIWSDYDGTNYNIVYRRWDGSSWGSQINLTNDSLTNFNASAIRDNSTIGIYVCWTTGTVSPYTIYFDTIPYIRYLYTIESDSKVVAFGSKSLLSLAKIIIRNSQYIISDSEIKIHSNINSNAKIKRLDVQQTIESDAKIMVTYSDTINSDALIKTHKNINSDAKVKQLKLKQTINSDSTIIKYHWHRILNSDAKIRVIGRQHSIISDSKIVYLTLANINQTFTSVKQILKNINNKTNTVIRVLSNINNFIRTIKGLILNINNDIRTQKISKSNINNDVRFIKTWQRPGNVGFQSLGKEYIKIYINNIEQTDVDVDSIGISKDLSTTHTAVFDLSRTYDSTKPTMESTISIKYNNWILFSGYITNISPSEDPEKIRINCRDEYWKQNKSNVYYHVGHQPKDDKELYYETLQFALSTQHSWNLEIGNFIPQTLDNFTVGKSDAITNLIQEMGNYNWFYNIDGSKKLCIAGEGSIIELERQKLEENINLYDVINHSFEESIENIINKFRVQMGNKVVRKFNTTGGSQTYTGYNYSSYHQFVIPAWDRSLELLSSQTESGYGFNHRNSAYDYSDVFTKYHMPYLDSELSSWSDRYPPYIEIYNIGNAFGFVGLLSLELEEVVKEGFTIDYENKIIKFSEPKFLYQTDANGECTAVRAPIVRVFLWKKNYFTYTINPTDNPETDVSNSLMFFTDKMGSYPDTIIKDLNLSNLSIQIGGSRILVDGTTEYIPSWDDTDFAKDYANWQLSKNCDKKNKGNIELTLDAVCYYNIDLTKRIFIDGITESPMNIISMSYNMNNFTVNIELENLRTYKRTVSLQSHGE